MQRQIQHALELRLLRQEIVRDPAVVGEREPVFPIALGLDRKPHAGGGIEYGKARAHRFHRAARQRDVAMHIGRRLLELTRGEALQPPAVVVVGDDAWDKRPAAVIGAGAGELTLHGRMNVTHDFAEAAGLVVVGVGIDQRDLVEAAFARLLRRVGEVLRGVEGLDGERRHAARREFHGVTPTNQDGLSRRKQVTTPSPSPCGARRLRRAAKGDPVPRCNNHVLGPSTGSSFEGGFAATSG